VSIHPFRPFVLDKSADALNFFRGLAIGVPISLSLWAVIICGVVALVRQF
jgi:hypothetical protein